MNEEVIRVANGPRAINQYARDGGWDAVAVMVNEFGIGLQEATALWWPQGEIGPVEAGDLKATGRKVSVACNIAQRLYVEELDQYEGEDHFTYVLWSQFEERLL